MAGMRHFLSTSLVLLTFSAGCSHDSSPVRATWNYVELTKDDDGEVKEVGDKHTLRSGGDEMVEFQGKRLEVVTVTSAKAKFRFSGGDSSDPQEAELQPGDRRDLWLGSSGVRLRVEKIDPL
jgi:hypothetical protein